MSSSAKQTLTRISLWLAVACMCSLSADSQQTTYTFVGRIFNDFYNTSCPPNCLLSGSFTLSQPLGANVIGNIGGSGDFTPLSFQFSDGVVTITQSSAQQSGFAVDTNGFAGITSFSWYADGDVGQLFTYFDGPGNLTQEGNNSNAYQAYYFGTNQNNGGGWTSKYQQGGAPWGQTQYDNYPGKTMAQKGCATTSLTMEANLANGGSGAFVDPGLLNTALINQGGYDNNHNVLWRQAAKDLSFDWIGVNVTTVADLAAALQNSAQAIVVAVPSISNCNVIGQKPPGHFVLATSATSDGHGGYAIGINDPGCASHTTLDVYPAFQSRGYFLNPQNTQSSQQRAPAGDESTLTFSGNNTIEVAVLDSNGRRTGYSQQGDKFEIPESYYYRDSITDADTGQDPTPLSHYLGINSPPAATYTLLITGLANGAYSVDISGYATNGSSEAPVNVSGTVNAGQTIAYLVTYSPQPGSTPIVGPKILLSLQ